MPEPIGSQIAESSKFGAEGRSGAPAADPTPLGPETDQLTQLSVWPWQILWHVHMVDWLTKRGGRRG